MKPRQLLKRIRAVERTEKITHAMEIVASIQLKKMQAHYFPAQEFSDIFEEIMKDLYFTLPPNYSIWFQENDSPDTLFIAIGSERGLCGAFNAFLAKEIEESINRWQGKGVKLIVVGKKFSFYCKKRFKVLEVFSLEEEIEELTRKIALMAKDLFEEGKVKEVFVVTHLYRSQGGQKVRFKRMLPIKYEEEKKRWDFLTEPSWEELITEIIPLYLSCQIYFSIIASRTAEELSRMLAMKYATDNARELIDELYLKYYRARQTQITRELLDITQTSRATSYV